MSKKKNAIANVGNFEITKESGPKHDYLRIKAMDGSWAIMHRDDSPMFGMWLAMCKDTEYAKGLEVRIVMEYAMTQILYDEGFIKDWWKAFESYNQRKAATIPDPTEQEEADAIAEVGLMEEVKKAIE